MRSRDDNARGAAECVIDSRDRKPRSIIPVVYERERCFNWFVARFEPVKQEKARGNDGLRTAVHARILQRAVMDAAADALAESLGSELLLATENAADDPNFSISPENCARYGIYCTVGAFDTPTHRATKHITASILFLPDAIPGCIY